MTKREHSPRAASADGLHSLGGTFPVRGIDLTIVITICEPPRAGRTDTERESD
jgi:hypothetical protein